jgi:hypothetical protein
MLSLALRTPIRGSTATNGVARAYWSEMLDIRLPVEDAREKRVVTRRKKLLRVRTAAAPRPRATA